MPELPDIEIFARNLKKQIVGKKIHHVSVKYGKNLKDSSADLSKNLDGEKIVDVYRAGKEFRILFSNDQLLGIHLMLSGDLFIFHYRNEHPNAVVEFLFTDKSGLVLTDRFKRANIKLNPIDKKGVDALDKKLNFTYLKSALSKKRTSIKKVLIDQDIIRGIGYGYSDEILWQTKISPYSIASAIPDHKIKELVVNIKKVLRDAIKIISKNYPDKLQGEVKEFLKIHRRDKSPTGIMILIQKEGLLKTYYTTEQVLYK